MQVWINPSFKDVVIVVYINKLLLKRAYLLNFIPVVNITSFCFHPQNYHTTTSIRQTCNVLCQFLLIFWIFQVIWRLFALEPLIFNDAYESP